MNEQSKTFGWARRPLFLYNPAQISSPRNMLTESDTYIIFSTTHLFLFEVVNAGWTRYFLITALSIREKKAFTKIINPHTPLGLFTLPSGSESGSVRIKYAGTQIHFIVMEQGNRIIKIDIPHFGGDNSLRGEVVLTRNEDSQSIVTNLPWTRERGRFQYTRCSPWFFVEGVMRYENKDIIFSNSRSWGIFLWKRIARPNEDTHYWAGGSGLSGDRHISFSVGYGSVNAAYATENAFFVGGRIHKLDYVTFIISPENWLAPWRFTSSGNQLTMRFFPLETAEEYYAGIRHSTSIRRVFGFFYGRFKPPDGPVIDFTNITGITEYHKTRR